jgi:hypothetical protein
LRELLHEKSGGDLLPGSLRVIYDAYISEAAANASVWKNSLTERAAGPRYFWFFVSPEFEGRKGKVFMANAEAAGTVRRWEDLASILLGIAAAVAAIFFHPALDVVVLNAVAAGLVIVALAALDLTIQPHWEEPFEMAIGAWLAVAPFWLCYGDPLRIAHILVGLLVVILAGLEFWQDRKAWA